MFDLNKQDGRKPKCYFTSSVLPTFLDHSQLALKKKPFSTILDQQCSHTLDILLPQDVAKALQTSLANGAGTLRYASVYMKLGELIEGDFFDHYIKSGNILMLSQGRPGIDHLFSLSEGMLRLEVDKPTYERMGLDGKPIPSNGRKHVKARYAIELNLRLPSMVHGKSGFQRIVWAFRNVLNSSVKWLFYDLKGANDGSGPIATHQPTVREVEPEIETLKGAVVPAFASDFEEAEYESATDLLEWLTLAMSASPRVQQSDGIDPYLSRYQVSQAPDTEDNVQDLVKFHWNGFIQPQFVNTIFLAALKASGTDWLALRASSFDGKAYTFLQNGSSTLTWEYQD